MLCFMCSKTGNVSPTTLLEDNIFLATALLKRTLVPEELHNVAVCTNCLKTFVEYVELHRKLANIEDAFSNEQSNREPEREACSPDNTIEIMDHNEDYMLDSIIMVEDGQLPSEEHEDPDLHSTDFNVEIVSTLEEHENNLDLQGLPEMPEKVFESDNLNVSDEITDQSSELLQDEPIPLKNYSKTDGGGFKCSFCDFFVERDSQAQSMVHHLQDCHFIRVVICDICGEEFRDALECTIHRKNHLSIKKSATYSCSDCSKTFTSPRQLSIHNRTVHEQPAAPKHGPWVCELCQKKCNSRALLEAHQNAHTGYRPYKCEICGAGFTSRYIFNTHMKIHTDRPRPFKCSTCDKSFLTRPNLTRHELTHTEAKSFECPFCQKTFTTIHNLQQHQQIHSGHKPFVCRTCGKAFARRVEIQDHERTHSGEKPFGCDICGAAFAQRSNLATHKRTTHLKVENHKCETCSRSFKRRRLLDLHVLAIHRKERAFKCQVCPLTYTYPEHLKKHMLTMHAEEKAQSCEICEKRFYSADARNLHRFIHSERKMYECMQCGKGFMRRPLLLSHMKLRNHLTGAIRVNSLKVASPPGPVGELTEGEEEEEERDKKEIELIVESKTVELVFDYEMYVEEEEEKSSFSGGEGSAVDEGPEEAADAEGKGPGGEWEKPDVIINGDKMFILEMGADEEQFIGAGPNGAPGWEIGEDGADQEEEKLGLGNIYMANEQFGNSSGVGIVKKRKK